jgi:predicted molibdopterin-dependent oxidoreductase YjgC
VRRAVPPLGDARPRWEMTASLLRSLGHDFAPTSAREVFALLARSVGDYAGLDYRAIGGMGKPAAAPLEAKREAQA